MHARYYSSSGGRFISVDRALGGRSAPQTWNRYAYARNNPVRYSDVDGNVEIDLYIRHFIMQHHVSSPTGNMAGNNRDFSFNSNASSKTALHIRLETDPARSASGVVQRFPPVTGLTHNYSLGLNGHAPANSMFNTMRIDVTRNDRQDLVVTAKTYTSIAFSGSLLGPLAPPIRSDVLMTISSDGTRIAATGSRSSSPSLEIFAQRSGEQSFAIFRGKEDALFGVGLFGTRTFSSECAGRECESNEAPATYTNRPE